MFDLLPDDLRDKAAEYLVADIRSRRNHLSTGFLGTPYICHVLSDNGYTDVAYDLLLQESYPSWLYPVKMGATTIWERWDGQKTDSTFQDAGMNSFNHYAYGAVGDWLYRKVAGIDLDPKNPGFKSFVIKPHPGHEMNDVTASHISPYGTISSSWKIEDGLFKLTVHIPVNTTAEVYVPTSGSTLEINGDQAMVAEQVQDKGLNYQYYKVQKGSGTYTFVTTYNP